MNTLTSNDKAIQPNFAQWYADERDHLSQEEVYSILDQGIELAKKPATYIAKAFRLFGQFFTNIPINQIA